MKRIMLIFQSLIFFTYSFSQIPRVTIITSLFKGDQFIEEFMLNLVSQSIFKQAEVIIINANSPGNEEKTIKKYITIYPNIRYIRLYYDPGIYAVWNMAIKLSHAPFIANANLDDRRTINSLEKQITLLEQHPDIDLVYSDYCFTEISNAPWFDLHEYLHTDFPEFEPKHLRMAIAGPFPVWRKTAHKKYGYFKEDFVASSDQEMWCRMASNGSRFLKAPGISGLYFRNPKGISSDQEEQKVTIRKNEDWYILQTYDHLWAQKGDHESN